MAEDVKSDRELPPFNRVAMDGYACRRADINKDLEILEIVPAGHQPQKIIGENQCAKVMTGCPLPKGAEMVFMVEYSEELAGNKVRFIGNEKQAKAANYALMGEDISAGEMVLPKGTLIAPKHIGVLASVGYAEPKVIVQPKVGIIATGDEIVEPSQTPEPHQIRNSNSYQLFTQIKRAGAIPQYYGIAADTFEAINSSLEKAASECDVILLSGGVSMGDFDLVPDVLKAANFEILFNKVAVKPGKPTTLAVSSRAVCFGMPGNPVSTFVIFEIMVKPFLYQLMGHTFKQQAIKLILAETFSRK
ncbi:MAG: molybdopterin molybdotransferase MoeA, partial [Calditrichia bacterium]|nr:molybdopterin molybdotransferase MoeA [Calditrichia bacterium]